MSQGPEAALKAQLAKQSLIWAFTAASGTYDTGFESFKRGQFQNSNSGE